MVIKPEKIQFDAHFWDLPFVKASASQDFKDRSFLYLQEIHSDEVVSMPADFTHYGTSESSKFECMGRGN